MSQESVVVVSFWAAFILGIVFMLYALILSKRMGRKGLLSNTTIFIGLSGLVFAIHHMLEIYLDGVEGGLMIAESIEGIAAILLGVAVYQFYKLIIGD